MVRVVLLVALAALLAQAQAPLAGVVRDASGGEGLERARLELSCVAGTLETRSAAGGEFRFEREVELPCVLRASLVGYRPLRVELTAERLAAGLELALTADTLARRDAVEVAAGPFELEQAAGASVYRLSGAELKNLAGVLADDPLRAVQSLPGVASSNDYIAQFSLRAAGFERTGVYLDGVLMHNPFHTVQGQESTGSLSIIESDAVGEMSLYSGAAPVRFADRSAAALEVQTREGSPNGVTVRVNAGVAASGVLAEGPLGRARRGAWLLAVRRSYLQYLLRRSAADDAMAFGFLDVQGKVNYELSPRQSLTASFFDGTSDLDRSAARARLGINSIMNGDSHSSLVNLGWRFAPVSRWLTTSRLAWLRERSVNGNTSDLPLSRQGYGEWVWQADGVLNESAHATLQLGGSLRRMRDEGFDARYQFNPLGLRRRDAWSATALRGGLWLEQDWTPRGGRLTLQAGGRMDGSEQVAGRALSPRAGASYRLGRATRLQLAWSRTAQFPELSLLTIERVGNRGLPVQRSTHTVAALEQGLNERTRLRVEVYERRDRDLAVQPLLEPRLLASGLVFNPPADAPWVNSVNGRARGVEIALQRRSANRFSGWLSYAYGWSHLCDNVTGACYAADSDQRQTWNGYLSYRLRSSLNLSARYSYGSNFPVPGFIEKRNGSDWLSKQRNGLRLPAYQRVDVRLNKSLQGRAWRGTLYVEVANLTNHDNRTFDSFNGYNSRTGQATITLRRLFPILPAAGLMLEWDGHSRRGR